MKALFVLAVLLGFGGTLAAAHYVPGLEHTRLPSHTSVVANGGRAEQFLIRLPADRLAATDGQVGGARALGRDAAMVLPAELAAAPLHVEHFKVRDAAGSVVGIAARHWTQGAGSASATWSVLVPSRGAMVLRAPGEAAGSLDAALARSGYAPGKPWNGQLEVPMVPASAKGELVSGSGEFAGLVGTFTETWTLAGVDDSGALLGNVTLDTVTSRPQ
jgi:hypothetical protein